MNANIKMIVTDLDDTLVRADKTISDYTKTVLRKCREAGIKVVYATGRGGSAERIAPSELFDAKITMNGAIAKIDEAIVYKRLVPYALARPILMACDNRGLKCASEVSGMHYANFDVNKEWNLHDGFKIVDFFHHKIDGEKLYVIVNSPEDIAFIERYLSEQLHLIMGLGYLAQIMHKEASKSLAVAEVAKIWGIQQSEIVAFGDDFNDMDLLVYAGIGVAVGNARDEVKAVADYVCDTNENDGLAKWLEGNCKCCAL